MKRGADWPIFIFLWKGGITCFVCECRKEAVPPGTSHCFIITSSSLSMSRKPWWLALITSSSFSCLLPLLTTPVFSHFFKHADLFPASGPLCHLFPPPRTVYPISSNNSVIISLSSSVISCEPTPSSPPSPTLPYSPSQLFCFLHCIYYCLKWFHLFFAEYCLCSLTTDKPLVTGIVPCLSHCSTPYLMYSRFPVNIWYLCGWEPGVLSRISWVLLQ